VKRNVTTLTKLTKLVTGRATRLVRAFLAVGLLCMMVLGIVSASQVSWTSASAQGPEPRFGGVFRAAMTANPLTLDPYAGTQIATREIGLHVFESLVTYGHDSEIIPQLAEKWDVSKDGRTYTFYLRKDVLFHNGKEMKAEDVKASIDRFKKLAARRAELDALEKVEVIGDYVINFHLSRQDGAFLAALANPICQLAIMPKETVEDQELNKIDIIGTGPYQFVEWIPDRHVRVRRFDGYKPWGGPASGLGGERIAYLDEILFVPVPEPGARVAGLETCEYDFADALPGTAIPRLSKLPTIQLTQLKPYTYVVVYINHSLIFKDLKMRQALQAALNQEEIMLVASDGAGRLDPGMYFREQRWHSDAGKELYDQRNPEKAKALLKEAGYKGEPIVMITNTDYDYMYKAALVVYQQLKKAGMNIKLEVYDWPGATTLRKDMSKWDLLFSSQSTRFDPTANDFYFLPSTTIMAYDNPKAVELIEKGRASLDFSERYAAYSDLQKLVYEDVAILRLFDLNLNEGYQDYVKGYVPWVIPHFWNVWFDKSN
jgi:peptide/nickel transport system substrate-binding protein